MAGASLIIVLSAHPAAAACGGSVLKGGIGAYDLVANTRGTKGALWVNLFDSHQYQSWRQVNVYENENNFAEVGWVTKESYDQLAHPFVTVENNGIFSSTVYSNINISRDQFHTFVVKDPDDNNIYQFVLDGSTFGLEEATIQAGDALNVAQSERACTSDSLWAKFRNLDYIGSGGNWLPWNNIEGGANENADPYYYCHVSTEAFDVRQSCQ